MPVSPSNTMRLIVENTNEGCADPAPFHWEWYNRYSFDPRGVNEFRLDPTVTEGVMPESCPLCVAPIPHGNITYDCGFGSTIELPEVITVRVPVDSTWTWPSGTSVALQLNPPSDPAEVFSIDGAEYLAAFNVPGMTVSALQFSSFYEGSSSWYPSTIFSSGGLTVSTEVRVDLYGTLFCSDPETNTISLSIELRRLMRLTPSGGYTETCPNYDNPGSTAAYPLARMSVPYSDLSVNLLDSPTLTARLNTLYAGDAIGYFLPRNDQPACTATIISASDAGSDITIVPE